MMKLFQRLIKVLNKYKSMQIKLVLNGKEINLTGDNTIIKSNNFNVDKNGNMTCNNANVNGKITSNDATITGGKITISGKGDSTDLLRISEQGNSSHFSYIQPIGAGFVYGSSNNAIYIQAGSTSILSVNDNDGITDISGSGIRTPTLTQTSKAESKKNFEKLENALDIVKKTDIYKYNLKSEEDTSKKHIGFVIGDNYNYAEEITSKENDGADIYSLASVCLQAIKEQQNQIELLQEEINKLKGEIYGKN